MTTTTVDTIGVSARDRRGTASETEPGGIWTAWRSHRGTVVVVIGLGVLYALGAQLPFWFLSSPESGAAFFPPAGLTLAALLLSRREQWPWLLAAVAVAELAVDLVHGQTLGMAFGFATANTLEPLVGALLIQAAFARHEVSARGALIIFLVFGVVAGPLVGGVIGGTVSWASGSADGWASTAGRWCLGDALGVLVLATPIVAWSRRVQDEPRAPLLETLGLAIVAMAVTLVPALIWQQPLMFAVLPVLILAAVRGGVRAVSLSGVGVALAADWAAVTGRADELVIGGTVDEQLALVQLFLAVTLGGALTLAVEVHDRRRSERELREAEVKRVKANLIGIDAAIGERQRLAREVHDIVGHTLNVVLLQAGAARRSLTQDPDLTGDMLGSIETVGRDAFRDLDAALGLVEHTPDTSPNCGLAFVPDLVDTMHRAGLPVELEVLGSPASIATIVDWSAYRIIQESLTNVLKHAPRAHARVMIRYEPAWVRLSVVDDGGGVPAARSGSAGRGLIGIRERASILGGRVDAGPCPEGGYAVAARLPVDGART
jgi:signal transduction histidine kinase